MLILPRETSAREHFLSLPRAVFPHGHASGARFLGSGWARLFCFLFVVLRLGLTLQPGPASSSEQSRMLELAGSVSATLGCGSSPGSAHAGRRGVRVNLSPTSVLSC